MGELGSGVLYYKVRRQLLGVGSLLFVIAGGYEWVWGPKKMTAQSRVFHERREVLLLQREQSRVREREHSHRRSALGLYFERRGVLCLS